MEVGDGLDARSFIDRYQPLSRSVMLPHFRSTLSDRMLGAAHPGNADRI
jgi:hypothetical protein